MAAFAPISFQQFSDLWQSCVDDAYSQPFIERGADAVFEAWEQEFTQFERVSEAIDVSTQSMYIMPWSGQSNPSAAGGQQATVQLTFQRSSLINLPMVLGTVLFVDEVTNDYGPDGPVPIVTGRRYSLATPLVFNPGEAGPFQVEATAERFGYGYNNPLSGTLNLVEQLGVAFSNVDAVYTYAPGGERLVAPNFPDMPIPQHVGQYMRFTSGLDAGAIKRVVGYSGPDVPANVGGTFFLESMAAVQGAIGVGTQFAPGEKVILQQITPAAYAEGVFVKQSVLPGGGTVVTFTVTKGALPPNPPDPVAFSSTLTGTVSGTILELTAVLLDPLLQNTPFDPSMAEPGSGWALVPWADPTLGWGLTVTNALQPQGGLAATLDELGSERNIFRASNESDGSYAERVHQLADTVSPNAILRAANRIMAPYGLSACLREVGQPSFVGFYLDHDAFDYDFTVRPSLGRHVLLDYEHFRAYFRIGVPTLPWGEFGFAYDSGPWNSYDNTGPEYLDFYDGFPWLAAQFYLSIYNAIANVVAGGVVFDLYEENQGCQP